MDDANSSLLKYLNELYEASGTLSTQIRSLAFAVIGVVWILSKEEKDNLLNYSGILFCTIICLSFDLLQYLWKTLTIGYEFNKKQKEVDNGSINEEFNFPPYIERGSWIFLGLKTISLIVSFVWLLIIILK